MAQVLMLRERPLKTTVLSGLVQDSTTHNVNILDGSFGVCVDCGCIVKSEAETVISARLQICSAELPAPIYDYGWQMPCPDCKGVVFIPTQQAKITAVVDSWRDIAEERMLVNVNW